MENIAYLFLQPLIRTKPISIDKVKTNTKNVVIYKSKDSMGSTVGLKLNTKVRLITSLNNNLRSQIIGHLLGDGWIGKAKTSKNPYFVFTQTNKRFDYIWHVFTKLSCLWFSKKKKIFYFF